MKGGATEFRPSHWAATRTSVSGADDLRQRVMLLPWQAREGKDAMNKEELVSFVRETHQLATNLGAVDRAKAGQAVKPETAATYAKLAAVRFDLSQPGGGVLMAGVSARSWHTIRAALLHETARAYVQARRACDAAQRAGDLDAAGQAAMSARQAVKAMEAVTKAEKPATITKRATKRANLPRAENWQEAVLDLATDAQRPAVAVLWATGCRPAELEAGVDIELRMKAGAPVLLIRIPGAKVTQHGGQPQREVLVDGTSAPGLALMRLMQGRTSMTVQRGATRLRKDFAVFRETLPWKISPYSMRHQVAANLKATFGTDELGAKKVATVLGHRTTKSQKRYGEVQQAKGQGGVIAARATHDVKENRPRPPQLRRIFDRDFGSPDQPEP